ncbi:MAG TPA: anthranilate phosphoribosyltransferase [Fimbriimonadaceae bacterium]|nr:anthranilate phosphoribosyltransferase [Fimbriimonadaceae bacterium]HRJ97578.1 anthranilate phosphoribosyltransferase [Fimbriimonadaceae bacterium]
MSARALLESLAAGRDLGWQEAQSLMRFYMSGEAEDPWIAGTLVALRMKGAKGSELAAFASVLRESALGLARAHPAMVDTCGTGGGRPSFNLSTAAAIVAAAAGAKVAKHGNRAVTSNCGSADVLEALGVVLVSDPEVLQHVFDSVGIVFLFAPHHHPAMRNVAAARKALGIRTVFNQLGPLANPAGANRQLIGVWDAALIRPMAEALVALACERSMVVHGLDGLDEISPCGPTRFALVDGAEIREGVVEPDEFGIEPLEPSDLAPGDTLAENAALLRRALSEPDSPQARAVLPNAAAALHLAGFGSLSEAADHAREAIRSGTAIRKLDELIEVTRSL